MNNVMSIWKGRPASQGGQGESAALGEIHASR